MPLRGAAHASAALAPIPQGGLPVRPRHAARALARLSLAALAAALLGACATPPLDRYLLTETEPVRIEGARGPLGKAQSDAIVAKLKAQSPQGSVLDHHLAIEEALTDNALTAGNRVTLLEDGKATYASMLAALRAAKSSISMEAYIFEDDEIGAQFASALEERAKAGVKVRLIYDSVGSNKTPKEFFAAMSAAGVEVVEFNPLSPETVMKSGLAALNHRDHRKLTVIDARVAFLGGINISDVYMSHGSGSGPSAGGSAGASKGSNAGKDYDPKDPPFEMRPWRDTQVRIEGPAVADLERAFLHQWAAQKKENLLDDKIYFPKLSSVGTQYVRVIEGSPSSGNRLNPLYLTLISAIDNAETEIRITMAYFVPHEELTRALKDAARRGVEVKLVLPSRTDSWLVFQAGRSYYEDLLEAGVKIYERKTRLLHAKTATIDGVWSTVGSTNLDWRSLLDNDELNAVVLGPEFALQMNAVFDGDLANSKAITREDWARRGIEERIKEAAARAWSRLL